MLLTDHDLRQIDSEYLKSLTPEKLLEVSLRMLESLKESYDRLNQNPQNSSRPSGSFAPWEGRPVAGSTAYDSVADETSGNASDKTSDKTSDKVEEKKADSQEQGQKQTEPKKSEKKSPGKQAGAEGHGRVIVFPVTGIEYHRACECAACGEVLTFDHLFVARTGSYMLDIEVEELGLRITHIKHLYGETHCSCGHITLTEPGRCEKEDGWNVQLTEWHLVGPTLASLIICLALRMRLSRRRIQEFLHDWLGIWLSVGVINKCITEGGRACEPIEEQLIEEIQNSPLLHADETGWKENGRLVWLWVLITANTTLFLIGRRSWDVIADALEGFAGWLMSDGYRTYRRYAKRLRCLAHLIRKARGLAESVDAEAAAFGEKILQYISSFIKAIYQARAGPEVDLKEKLADDLEKLKELCKAHKDSKHKKTKDLARELLYDWDAIWTVLEHPTLPITNNRAEQALRHWIIARKISFGTRTKQGSRAFTLLASVIETCRQRGISPWAYLAQVIAKRRQGHSAPPLPSASC